MARIEDFEGCCTAKIIVDLGGSHTSEFGYHPAKYDKLWKDIVHMVKSYQSTKGIICAIATSEQVTAQKVLKDLGFTGTGMAKKGSHPEVDIELFYLHCKDWKEPAKPADIVAPEAPVAAPQPFAAARQVDPQLPPVQPRRHAQRDARGRFVSRDEQRGYIVVDGRPDHFIYMIRESGYVRPNLRGEFPLEVTRLEFEQLQLKRMRVGLLSRLTFQPI